MNIYVIIIILYYDNEYYYYQTTQIIYGKYSLCIVPLYTCIEYFVCVCLCVCFFYQLLDDTY